LRGHGGSGAAAESAHVEGRARGVAHHQAHALEWDAQLVGHTLRERGANVLPDLDLAGEDGDAAVFADMQPGADFLREWLAAARAATGFLRRSVCRNRQGNDHARSGEFEEIAAAPIEMMRGAFGEFESLGLWDEGVARLAHRGAFFMASAARAMAWTMRGCVPQRQMLPCMNSTICCGEGLGFCRSSVTPVRIMPEVQ